jgi:hypothetical protein
MTTCQNQRNEKMKKCRFISLRIQDTIQLTLRKNAPKMNFLDLAAFSLSTQGFIKTRNLSKLSKFPYKYIH